MDVNLSHLIALSDDTQGPGGGNSREFSGSADWGVAGDGGGNSRELYGASDWEVEDEE